MKRRDCGHGFCSGDVSFFEKSLRILQLVKRPVPAAVQSIVVSFLLVFPRVDVFR